MLLLKSKMSRKGFQYLKTYQTRFYGSGVNPQIMSESKIDKEKSVFQQQKIKKDDQMLSNPFSHIEQSMGISPIFDSSLKDISDSIKVQRTSDDKKQALTFEDIPGPHAVRYIANIWKYIPAAGTQLTRSFMINVLSAGSYFKLNERVKLLSFLFDQYGPVVRVMGPFGGDIVLLSRPDHMQSVFNQEGPQPVRSAFDSLEYYRTKHRKFDFPGLYSVQGEEWNQQRTLVENSLKSSLSRVKEQVNGCCDEVITLIPKIRNRQDEVEIGFEHRLFKWGLECMGHILFSERLGLLEGYDSPQGDALWLEEALSKTTQALASCETGLQIWKIIETPAFKKLIDNCNALDSVIGQYVRQTEIELHNRKSQDKKLVYTNQDIKAVEKKILIADSEPRALIKALLLSEKMKSEDILTCFMDMLIVGVNSSASAMSFILYHLSRSQRAQKRLYEELTAAPNGTLNYEQIAELPYLKACIKESLRLVPPFPVLTRILPKNIVVDHYKIPHGTTMVMAMQVTGLKEENFDDSKRFYPERWLKPDVKELHPLATLPFGFGSRKCIGQGLANIMLSTLTAKIIKNYKVEFNYGDITPVTKLIAMPDHPLRFRFIDRD